MKNPNQNSKRVQITHVVNPHQFYFKYSNDSVNSEFSKFDFEVQRYGNDLHRQNTYDNGYIPTENELVIFFHVIFNKWIRGRVVHIGHEITLWCIDNGISEKCEASHVLPLAPRFHEDMKLVHLGGLTLLPTEKILNVHTVEVETHLSEKWDEKTISYLKGIVNTSKTFMFTEEFELSNHKFGLLAIEILNSVKKKDINNILLAMNNVAHSDQYIDTDLRSYISKEKLNKHLYHSLTTLVKDALSIKSDVEIPSIKNLAPTELYEDFDDSVSQISRHSSNTSTMLETKSSTSSIIHQSGRDSEEERCERAAVSNFKKLSIHPAAAGSLGISNLKGECYDDFDDSVGRALSSTAQGTSSSSSSHIYRNKDMDKKDYECYLRSCKIESTKKLRRPLASTMNWINSMRKSTSADTMAEYNKSVVSSINNLKDNIRSDPPSPALSMTSTTTVSRRNMLAKLAKKESMSESTNIVHSFKNSVKHCGVPAGYAKNRLDTFGGPSNKK